MSDRLANQKETQMEARSCQLDGMEPLNSGSVDKG
jgi:hypothetical protein